MWRIANAAEKGRGQGGGLTGTAVLFRSATERSEALSAEMEYLMYSD